VRLGPLAFRCDPSGWVALMGPGVLVELGVVEQRYRTVLEVLEEGAAVTEVACRYGVARQTVHE
jgi:DNA-binding NarL/FixJ family response regulator